MKKSRKIILYGLAVVVILAGIGLAIPRVRASLSFRISQVYSNVKYALFPPEKSIFVPGQSGMDSVSTAVQATLQALVTPSATVIPAIPQTTPTITSSPMPLPSRVFLKGVRPEQQRYNNCGPATLSMYLSYYDWVGNLNPDAEIPQDHIAPYLKPNPDDKNVMLYEMQTYVQENTGFGALVRMGGDLHILKSLLAAGFPVMVEKGFEGRFEGWMGHYNLVIGYDDAREIFFTQDSYNLLDIDNWQNFTGFEVPYDTMISNWRAFNNVFLVVYPQDMTNDVLNTLGSLMNETNAYRVAYDRAFQEVKVLTDPRDLYFAWFNAGTSLVYLKDHSGAAMAYDTAFGMYPLIPEKSRPWRIVWYQTGPYFAYYYTQRYHDVIALADETLTNMSSPKAIEETYYWRALAKLSLGDQDGAVNDLRESLIWHEGFTPSVNQLTSLGLTP